MLGGEKRLAEKGKIAAIKAKRKNRGVKGTRGNNQSEKQPNSSNGMRGEGRW